MGVKSDIEKIKKIKTIYQMGKELANSSSDIAELVSGAYLEKLNNYIDYLIGGVEKVDLTWKEEKEFDRVWEQLNKGFLENAYENYSKNTPEEKKLNKDQYFQKLTEAIENCADDKIVRTEEWKELNSTVLTEKMRYNNKKANDFLRKGEQIRSLKVHYSEIDRKLDNLREKNSQYINKFEKEFGGSLQKVDNFIKSIEESEQYKEAVRKNEEHQKKFDNLVEKKNKAYNQRNIIIKQREELTKKALENAYEENKEVISLEEYEEKYKKYILMEKNLEKAVKLQQELNEMYGDSFQYEGAVIIAEEEYKKAEQLYKNYKERKNKSDQQAKELKDNYEKKKKEYNEEKDSLEKYKESIETKKKEFNGALYISKFGEYYKYGVEDLVKLDLEDLLKKEFKPGFEKITQELQDFNKNVAEKVYKEIDELEKESSSLSNNNLVYSNFLGKHERNILFQKTIHEITSTAKEFKMIQEELVKGDYKIEKPDLTSDIISNANEYFNKKDLRKGLHINSKEYTRMIDSLDALRKWTPDKEESLETTLNNLRESAEAYLVAKGNQTRKNPSALRNYRLGFAESLISFVKVTNYNMKDVENESIYSAAEKLEKYKNTYLKAKESIKYEKEKQDEMLKQTTVKENEIKKEPEIANPQIGNN